LHMYLSDIDECATGSHTCGNKPNSTCNNTEGSFECPCAFGYESSDNGKTCEGKHCPSKDFFHSISLFFRIGDCQFTQSGSRCGRNLKRNLSTDCRVTRKPVPDANPGLKANRSIHFSCKRN